MHAAKHPGGGSAAAIISAVALLFSGFSLWETSLKRAELDAYVTGVVTYERDRTAALSIQPDGGFEVLAVPITIANGGARDGPVLGLQLDAKNLKTGLTARFEATYAVDGTYFAAKGDRRPKTPFSALVIAGRAAWTGTVLFYPVSYGNNDKSLTPLTEVRALHDGMRKKYADEMGGSGDLARFREKRPDLPEWSELDAYYAKVFNGKDKVQLVLKLMSPAPSGWLDRMLGASVQPITLTIETPDVSVPTLLNGEIVRLRRLSERT